MGDLSRNLSRSEFACKCGCGFDVVDHDLVIVLQGLVDFYGKTSVSAYIDRTSIVINSGCRCPSHNKKEGGSKNSRHTKGNAADFRIFHIMSDGTKSQVDPDLIANHLDLKFPTQYGVGWYNGRTHFDVSSSGRRRWDKR